MNNDNLELSEILMGASERLNLEFKGWLDLGDPASRAKIIKGAIAMRNRNGGLIVIGINNKTGVPDPCPIANVREMYHADEIQSLIGRFSQHPFEVIVKFLPFSGIECPVLVIPAGVTVPVAIKSELKGDGGRTLLRFGEVPFRTTRANNLVSSAAAAPQDWEDIVRICFDNREADIGSFFRRHLPGVSLASFADGLQKVTHSFADSSWQRFADLMQSRGGLSRGSFEVACCANPQIAEIPATQALLNKILIVNPSRRSWPIWVDTRSFSDGQAHFKVYNRGFEALINKRTFWDHQEFFRIEPKGNFYACSRFVDDASASHRGVVSEETFDAQMAFAGVAEAIIVAQAFSQAIESTSAMTLQFTFRWRGLSGRRISNWSVNGLPLFQRYVANDEEIVSDIEVPANLPNGGVVSYAKAATEHLFAAFNGYQITPTDAEHFMKALLEGGL